MLADRKKWIGSGKYQGFISVSVCSQRYSPVLKPSVLGAGCGRLTERTATYVSKRSSPLQAVLYSALATVARVVRQSSVGNYCRHRTSSGNIALHALFSSSSGTKNLNPLVSKQSLFPLDVGDEAGWIFTISGDDR